VAHGGITRAALTDEFGRRFGAVAFADLADTAPPTSLPTADAAELSRLRRGLEPLRVAVAPQRDSADTKGSNSRAAEPMPVAVA